MTKLICISDTHSDHDRLKNLPTDGDLIIHSGDCTHEGKFQEFIIFMDWYSKLPYKHKVLIPGNHDFILQEMPVWAIDYAKELGIHLLIDSGVEIEGFKIWGTPWVPYCGDWAYCTRDNVSMICAFNKIPLDTNILVSHGPPKGSFDNKYGSEHLASAVSFLKELKLHQFGHIHEAYGVTQKRISGPGPCRGIVSKPFIVNAAMAGCKQHAYKNCASNHKPIVLELNSGNSDSSATAG